MVKSNNGTKMMVNRCIELLNDKIAKAQTRHIPKRLSVARLNPWSMNLDVLQRERQKCQDYEVSKRRSMWEQDKPETGKLQKEKRLDHSHYKHYGVNERRYDCTWADFPEPPRPKPEPTSLIEEHIPFNRRKSGHRPETAKPCDAEATDFLKQWDNQNIMISGRRYSKITNSNLSATKRHYVYVNRK